MEFQKLCPKTIGGIIMGYDISVRCRTKELKNRMEKFFKENYRFPHQIFKDQSKLDLSIFLIEDPSMTFAQFYEQFLQNALDGYSIGLHYGMIPGRYRLYMHSVLCWMAQAVGRKHFFQNIQWSCPYIKNDVHGITPIVPKEIKILVPKTQRRFVVDRIGRIIFTPNQEVSKIDIIYIKHEIKRLDILWKKYNFVNEKKKRASQIGNRRKY